MRNLKLAIALAAMLIASACPALAQNEFKTPAPGKTVVGFQVMCQDGGGNAVPCSASFPLNIVGSLTASLGGFHPETSLTPITAAVGGATSSAFAAGKDVLAQNTGATNAAYCFPGNAASASSEYIPPGGSALIHTVAETTVTCVTASSTTNINLQVGVGLWTGAGAGGGGGSGGAVNLTQILGAAPSATNPLWVSPATGATFPISAASLPLPSGAATSATQGATTDAPCTIPATTTACSEIAIQKAVANASTTSIPPGTNPIGTVQPGNTPNTVPWLANPTSQYPSGATPITASTTGTTAATTATLAGTAGKTTYICGYSIRANATAAATVTDTLTGVITGTMSSVLWVAPAASGLGVDEQIFSPCIPASAQNTGIGIVSGAPGAGGNVTSKGWGYQL